MKKFLRSAAVMVSLAVSACVFAACGDEPAPPPPDNGGTDGWYVLENKTVQNVDTTAEYLYNCMYLKEGAVSWYEIDYTGMTEQTGTYSAEEDKITVTIGIRPYEFSYSDGVMSYSGKINKKNVAMRYRYDKDFVLPVAESGASFTEELFGDDINENFYNYCPSVMMDGNTMHVYYCTNKVSGNVTDYVGYRKGTLNASGKWEFSEKQYVLAPSGKGSDKWDAKHICDPSVTKGKFTMGGEEYSYLMAYLACDDATEQWKVDINQVGIAVAKAPDGPWIKVESINPIANYFTSEGVHYWGYGQPCVINPEGGGEVYLFYSKGVKGGTYEQAEKWDFSDLDHPVKLKSAKVREKNVVNASGSQDCINNADFAYDPVGKRLWCIKEDFPYPTDHEINWLAKTNVLMYADLGEEGLDRLFGEEIYSWNKSGVLQPTGKYVRAHNACIVTDPLGRTVNAFRMPVLYTVSEAKTAYPDWNAGGQWPALHTYRIHGTVFDI